MEDDLDLSSMSEVSTPPLSHQGTDQDQDLGQLHRRPGSSLGNGVGVGVGVGVAGLESEEENSREVAGNEEELMYFEEEEDLEEEDLEEEEPILVQEEEDEGGRDELLRGCLLYTSDAADE